MREVLEEETILKCYGLLSRAASLLTDASVAYPDDWLLNSKMFTLKMLKSNGQSILLPKLLKQPAKCCCNAPCGNLLQASRAEESQMSAKALSHAKP